MIRLQKYKNQHCLECSGYEKKEVRECIIKDCVLYLYRQGKNPNRKKCVDSSEELTASSAQHKINEKKGFSTTSFKKGDGYVSEG